MAELTARIPTWDTLHCPACDGATFVALMELKTRSGGGTTPTQVGWGCSGCGQPADIGTMQRNTQLKQRQAELRLLEAELTQEMAQPTAVPRATPGRSTSSRS